MKYFHALVEGLCFNLGLLEALEDVELLLGFPVATHKECWTELTLPQLLGYE
jgi:hypothetical protein